MKALSVAVLGGLLCWGCAADFVETSEANVILRIVRITGESGHDSEEGDFILSDVTPNFNDNATLEMEVIAKNPRLPDPGIFNDVYVSQYEVRYVRSDGRAVEGVDVPFHITGNMATLVPVDGTASAAIVVVRHQAKDEPPLRNIRGGGGAILLTVMANITVFGHTTAGQAVQASGSLQISFADFAND